MWMMPSYGRPGAPRKMLDCPGGMPKDVVVIVNFDDPTLPEYQKQSPWPVLVAPPGARFCDAIRHAFFQVPPRPYYGIIDDDYWPVTPGWWEKMVAAAGDREIAIANNRVNFPKLYTCRIMGGELARAIGDVAPGGMRHNYSDDTWAQFAEDFKLLHALEDVIVEHRHHLFDKSVAKDTTYERGSSDIADDRALFVAWLNSSDRIEQCNRVAALFGSGKVSAIDLSKVHLGICVPIQDTRVGFNFHIAMHNTLVKLSEWGIKSTFFHSAGGSNIGKTREHILWWAMSTPVTHLLWIDDDEGWDPHLVRRLLASGHDFTGVPGCRKVEELSLCFNPLPDPQRFHSTTGFLEARDVGFGFVLLKRSVISRMCEAYPELRYNTGDKPPQWALFLEMIDKNDGPHGERLSEDFSFCRRWRAIGGEIWLDPHSAIIHDGHKSYTGRIADVLRVMAEAA